MDAMNRFDLSGKIAVVTGGRRGIGRGISVGLAQHGADVAIVATAAKEQSADVLDEIRGLGRKAWYYRQDLGRVEELPELADRIWGDTGRVDILVNNAGTAYLERFNEISLENWRRVMAVNVDAVFFFSQRIAEHMIAAKLSGRIINNSSVNGYVAEAGLAHYNASKGAVELITKSLAVELGQHGITVNSLCPGMIVTEIGEDFALAEDFAEYFKGHIPLENRLGVVEDCVGAVIFFASEAGRYVTGQTIIADGGILSEQVPRMQFMPPYKSSLGA
jgi:NAD(P)-dependent dehydrogenase (short-subunit alcohol dehydrogenase family)